MTPVKSFGAEIVIDPDGYRPNVGIVLMRSDGQLFWARRVHRDGWQFPQGGMRSDETPVEAMFRELEEETGLRPEHVEVLGSTPGWLRYRLPPRLLRRRERPLCVGQKQVWFLLRLVGDEERVRLDASEHPSSICGAGSTSGTRRTTWCRSSAVSTGAPCASCCRSPGPAPVPGFPSLSHAPSRVWEPPRPDRRSIAGRPTRPPPAWRALRPARRSRAG
jgi:8-oxo-dGTP pyrophosphatase MutT (NUDIX family)